MGKSNRIRSNRASVQAKALGTPKKKKGMPSWLMTLITLVVAVAILLTVALSLLFANGVFNRLTTSMSSDHFRVNANMMTYYFHNEYQSFTQEYGNYLEYGYFSLDSSRSLKDQPFGGSADSTASNSYMDAMLITDSSNPPATWFDYFMQRTTKTVSSMLVYCEEAHARNLSLNEDELATIDQSIDALSTAAATYGYTTDSYISAMYGSGVKVSDVRKAMEYSSLATKCMTTLSEDLENAITADRVNAAYDADKQSFDVVDYLSYSFSVTYEEIAESVLGEDYDSIPDDKKETILTLYRAKIATFENRAEALKSAADSAAFEKMVLEYVAEDAVEDTYGDQTIADADKPANADDITAIKTAMKAELVADALADKETTADAVTIADENAETVTAYEKTVKTAYAKILNTVKKSAYKSVLAAKESISQTKVGYSEGSDVSEWAFDEGRAVGDVTVIVTGDGEAEGGVPADLEEYTDTAVSVYRLEALRYKDPAKSKNVAYILYQTEAEALAAIEELKKNETLTFEIFEDYAHNKENAGHAELEDYVEGNIGSADFDKWLFAETTAIGTLTAKPIELAENTYCVAFYHADGAENWYVDVKTTLLNEDYEAYYKTMEGKYAITVKEKSFSKIDA